MKQKKTFLIGFCILALGIVGILFLVINNPEQSVKVSPRISAKPMVFVKIPELSSKALQGRIAYENSCAVCHGINAAGQEGVAPPLVHKIYEPSHHGDGSFLVAAKNGVRAHHWPFGNMPRIENIKEDDVKNIVTYVRELQRANGIN